MSIMNRRMQRALPEYDGPLWFRPYSRHILQASKKKVYAHYFPMYPLQKYGANWADYYSTEWLNPAGEGGVHATIGGWLRDRPLPIPTNKNATMEHENYVREVTRARDAGLDGFFVDILDISNPNQATADYFWGVFTGLLDAAAEVDPNFKIAPMFDDTNASVNLLISRLSTVLAHPALLRLDDGRLVISAFSPDQVAYPNGFWQTFLTAVQSKCNEMTAFVPCMEDYWAHVDTFAPISYGIGVWGWKNPTDAQLTLAIGADVKKRGLLWMAPVSLQDTRPYTLSWVEANHSQTLRDTWQQAIQTDADWIQMVTWNDYSENTQFSPSSHVGWFPLEVSSYYITALKTGQYPAVAADVLYLSHRIQPYTALATYVPPTGSYTPMILHGAESGYDTVEVLAFLTAPATLTIDAGGSVTTKSIAAGMSVTRVDLHPGVIQTWITRNSTTSARISSPFTVTTTPYVQDLNYYFLSSRRGNSGSGSWNDTSMKSL